MKRNRRAPGRRGISLLYLLVSLIVMTVLSIVVVRLFAASLKAYRDDATYAAGAATFDAVLRRCERDVWTAESVEVSGEELLLAMPDGEEVTWAADAHLGELTRKSMTDPAGAVRWTVGEVRFEGAAWGAVLRLGGTPVPLANARAAAAGGQGERRAR